MQSGTLSWTAGGVENTSYIVEYKKDTDSVWTTAPGSPTTSLSLAISGLDDNTDYDFRVTAVCAAGNAAPVTTSGTTPGELIWVVDTYTCAQDAVFTQVSQVTGLSSPRFSYYYESQDRLYVMDQDDTNGVFWYIDPDTFTVPGDRTYISGTNILTQAYAAVADRQYNRLYSTGYYSGMSSGTTGLLVYDIVADDTSMVIYGSNGSSDFSRTSITVEGNNIYCGDRTTNTITIINRSSLAVTSTVDLSTVPTGPGGKAITAGCNLHFINGEIWAWNTGDPGTNDIILRYNTSLTSVLGSIDTSAYRALWQVGVPGSEGFWGRSYFDASKNRLYCSDVGLGSIIVIDTTTNTIDDTYIFTNKQGYNNVTTSFVTDPITNDLYAAVQCSNNASTPNTRRTYRLNRDSLYFEQVYPSLYFSQLERIGTTNILYGMDPGQPRWNGGSWATDGVATKFSR